MANSQIGCTEGAGLNLDAESATVGGQAVVRQRIQIAGVDGDSTINTPAHDAVDSGAPLKIGGYANQSAPTNVAAADRVNAWFDISGALHVAPIAHIGKIKPLGGSLDIMGTTVFDATVTPPTTQPLVAAAASNYTYVLWMSVGASANSTVNIRDGSAGSSLYKVRLLANSSVMLRPQAGLYLFRSSINTALHVDIDTAATVVITLGRLVSQANVNA